MFRSTAVVVLLAACAASPGSSPVRRPLLAERVLSPGCAGSAYTSIQAAIEAAADGDTISVCAGTYDERLRIVGKDLTLRSKDGAAATRIDAEDFGRALTVSGGATVTVDGFTFAHGSTAGNGGNVSCTGSELELVASRLEFGQAGKGGGLAASACTGRVSSTTFEGNTSVYFGGAAWIFGGSFGFDGNTVTSNTATSSGGGLYLDANSAVRDNTFTDNEAEEFGGGLYVDNGYGEISGNRFEGNRSVNDGGGAYVMFGSPQILRNTWEGNDSSDEGGGLRVKLSTARVDDNLFVANHADYRGGGMKVSHEAITMSRNTFIDNTTWVAGGGLAMVESASLLVGNEFFGNTADLGGGLYILDGWGPVEITDGIFDGNAATTSGGNLYVDLVDEYLRLRRVAIQYGSAKTGGGMYAVGSLIDIQNALFQRNVATDSGGGVSLDATGGRITNSVFWWNDARDGSGLVIANGVPVDPVDPLVPVVPLDLANNVFASNLGGASLQLLSGTEPTVRYNDFHLNTSDVSGLPNPIGSGGNEALLPGFRDPGTNDFTLLSTSTLIDRGDPEIRDVDGTRSDMGLYGGPEAD